MEIKDRNRIAKLLFLNKLYFLRASEKHYILSHFMNRQNEQLSEKFFEKISNFSAEDWKIFLGRNVRAKSLYSYNYKKINEYVLKDMHWNNTGRGSICTIEDADYPVLLKEIPDPPIILYLKGCRSILNQLSVSIVGTRKPNVAGKSASYSLGYLFCKEGYHIVSGFARGIDIYSHMALIDAHTQFKEHTKIYTRLGKAIVVLGTPVDQVYPKEYINLAKEILALGGIIVSEYSPFDSISKYCFVARNRIISGLSMNTIIVQAPKNSGALATAFFGIEQGRTVWVHEVGNSQEFLGTKLLVEDGAELISTIDKIK